MKALKKINSIFCWAAILGSLLFLSACNEVYDEPSLKNAFEKGGVWTVTESFETKALLTIKKGVEVTLKCERGQGAQYIDGRLQNWIVANGGTLNLGGGSAALVVNHLNVENYGNMTVYKNAFFAPMFDCADCICAGPNNYSVLKLDGGSINGLVTNYATFDMLSGEITQGVQNSGVFRIYDGYISDAEYAVYVRADSIFYMNGGFLQGNGYGVYVERGGTFEKTDGIISGNTCNVFMNGKCQN